MVRAKEFSFLQLQFGFSASAVTFSMMTFCIMTLSIMTFSIVDLIVTLSLKETQNKRHSA